MSDQVQQLSAGRIAIGAAAWAAPGLVRTLLRTGGDKEGNYVSRLFGAREIALGLGTMSATGETRQTMLRLGVLCDAMDVVAAVACKREGSLGKATGLAFTAVAAGAVAIGFSELQKS